jgi:hypothetical protein
VIAANFLKGGATGSLTAASFATKYCRSRFSTTSISYILLLPAFFF